MEAVRDSAEHHFIETVEAIKADSAGWMAFRFRLSVPLSPESLMTGTSAERLQKLESARRAAVSFFDIVREKTRDIGGGTIWLFADNDILILAKVSNAAEKQALLGHFRALADSQAVQGVPCEILPPDLYTFQKIADEKLLSARRMEVYAAMADGPRARSIGTRRKRRSEPIILIVEDDRFTASYTAGILGKSYDLIHVRTGEEAVLAHIEHAPDVVLMDIHLPGLSGHEALGAIRAVDPGAFVVMLSVDSEKTGVLSASQRGAGGFLKKPVSKERLLASVMKSPFVGRTAGQASSERETTIS